MILCSPVGTLGATLSTRASATRQAVAAPHTLSPADAHGTGDEVFKVRSTDAGGEHDLRGKREEGQGGYKWIGWLATRHRHNIRLMEYHITVSVVTCYY